MTRKVNESGLLVPPHANDAEQAVLGALMLSEAALPKIADWLDGDDFYSRKHRAIYSGILDLQRQGKPHDAVTLAEWFAGQGLDDVPASYVIELANTTPSAANVTAYAEIVREKSRLRAIIDNCTKASAAAFAPRGEAALIASEAMAKLSALTGDQRLGGLKPARAAVIEWWQDLIRRHSNDETMTGVASPWREVDELTLGWQDGDLIILAARPSIGKSVLLFQALGFNALAKNRTDLFSLEMSARQAIQRLIAAYGKVSYRGLQKPSLLSESDWPRITNTQGIIGSSPLFIDDQAGLTAAQICARARRQHMRTPTTLIGIDHLHEVRREGRDLVNEIGDDVRQFKRLAKELNVPVILLCQLNRANATRSDRRPTLSDLRASGSIEEVADVVAFIHREDYYDRETHLKGVIELNFAKGRDIPLGDTIYLKNRYDQMRADDWEGPLPLPVTKEKAKDDSGSGMGKRLKDKGAAHHTTKDDLL